MTRHRFDGLSFAAGVVVVTVGLLGGTGRLGESLNHPEKLLPVVFGLLALLLVASVASGHRPTARGDGSPHT